MARNKEEKLDGIHLDAYSNSDAFILDKVLRLQLASARKSKNISQAKLAELSGLSVSSISSIESGESTSPTLRSLIKYTSALDLELTVKYK